MNDFAADTDSIADKLVAGGMDPQQAMTLALRLSQSKQQSLLSGVPVEPLTSDVPPVQEPILGGDVAGRLRKDPSFVEKAKGYADAAATLGSAVLASPAMPFLGGRPDLFQNLIRTPRTEMGGELVERAAESLSPLGSLPPITGVSGAVLAGPAIKQSGQLAAKGAKQLAPKAGELMDEYMRRTGMRLDLAGYHGSPYAFEKFDPNKIGSGEGAQAFGYGHYLAENPETGEFYQRKLSGKPTLIIGGQEAKFNPDSPDALAAARLQKDYEALGATGKSVSKEDVLHFVKDSIDRHINLAQKQKNVPLLKNLMDQKVALDRMVEQGLEFKPAGFLYKFDIPDQMINRMLDYDKPLSQQSPAIKKAINDIVQAEELYKGKYAARFLDKNATGGDILGVLNEALGSPKAASGYLKDAGIPGIRYLDQGSRDSGKGTRNFVIFPGEEENIKLLERKKEGGSVRSFNDGGLVEGTDKIVQQLIEQGMDRDSALTAALRMQQTLLGGVVTQPPMSDVPSVEEPILGGDTSKLFQRDPTLIERAKQLPADVLGAGEALASLGSAAALMPASMMYALRPGQKTQGNPLEFMQRNMYIPRTESGARHLQGLGEVLESLPQTGPLPELQPLAGMGRAIGRQVAKPIERTPNVLAVSEPSPVPTAKAVTAAINVQPVQTVQLPSGQFATTTGFSQVKQLRTGFDTAETREQVAHLTAGLRKSPQEQLVAVVVDENNRPIQVIRHTIGTSNQALVEPFSIVGAVANTPGAKGFYVSHNHPSGKTSLSEADKNIGKLLKSLTNDTGIEMRGIMAVGSNKFSFYGPDGTEITEAAIPPAVRNKSLNMVERVFKRTQVMDKTEVGSPTDAAQIADKIAGDETGVVLFNQRRQPVAFVPLNDQEFMNLRKSGAAETLFRSLEKANANSGMLVTKKSLDQASLENVAALFDRAGAPLIDVLTGPQRKSQTMAGQQLRGLKDFKSLLPAAVTAGALASQKEEEFKQGGHVKAVESARRAIMKAMGGSVKMAGGGLLSKAAKGATKGARAVLSPAESEANLQRMLAESQIKERLFHGTTATEGGKGEEAIRRIKPSKEGALGAGAYLTPKADFAGSYAESAGGNVLPVYAQIKKPLIIEGNGDPMVEALVKLGMEKDKAARMVERAYENKGYIGKEVQVRALSQGYDGLMQYRNGDLSEVVVYNPNAIKSAIGNEGTYDITNPELSKSHGGLAHMAGGGLGKALKGAATAGRKSTELAREAAAASRAPAKSKQEIEEIARRIAEQTQPGFVRASPESSINPAGKSQLQYELEQRTPMVVESTIADRPVNPIDYEQQLGKVIVGVPGDPTMGQVAAPGSLEAATRGGKQLVQVGDVRPETPVQLYGGPRYGANLDEVFWASNLSPARAVQNLVKEMAEKYGPEQVLGKYIKMSPESSRFAMHNLDALISVLQPEKLPKDKIELLNNLVRKGTPKRQFPQFPGFEDPINLLLQAQMDSKLRKHIADVLEKPTVAKEVGFPFPGKVVQSAITEPELRNVETGITGYAIGKMNPEGKLTPSSHPTYEYDIPGQAIGKSKYLVPYEVSFPDFAAWYRSRPDVQAKVDPVNMMKSYGPRQVIDQQYIDEMKMYEEAMKRLTGKKKGGLAKMASGGALSKAAAAAAKQASKRLPQVEGMVEKVGDLEKISILPVPNRWFLQPDKFPKVQSLIETILETTGKTREDFGSGAFVNSRTGEILDGRVMNEVGVVINPTTKRPMMSGLESGLETLDPKLGSFTKSNLVRQSLFKPTGGDPLLSELPFIATIEKGGPHFYGISTEYASPTELYNTMRGDNPTLRPRSRGDLFGVGDVIGRVKVGAGPEHDVYEKLFVAPKGSDVEGKLLKKRRGGKVGGLSALRKKHGN